MKIRAYYKGVIAEDQKFRGQARLIIDQLANATDAASAVTTKALADAIKPALITRQDPERVVAFYMSVWKKKGIVRLVEVDTPGTSDTSDTSDGSSEPVVAAEDAPDQVGTIAEALQSEGFPQLEGKKLSQAVLDVMAWRGGPLVTEGIVTLMAQHGHPVKDAQVNGALQNLVKRGAIVRSGEAFVTA